MSREYEYDVGLSFAGEQRDYVSETADRVKRHGIRVFYDEYERAKLWGKDLYVHLDDVYQHRCKYCVIFVSREYAEKVWPTAECRSAQARALKEKQEYILPVRFDDTTIPGLRETIGYLEASQFSPCDIADLLRQKLGKPERENYLPEVLDRLYERLGIDDDPKAQRSARNSAVRFLSSLRKTTIDERAAILNMFLSGCPAAMPDNIHINIDLLSRETGETVPRLKQILGGIQSLGFLCSFDESDKDNTHEGKKLLGHSHLVYMEWVNLSVDFDDYYPAMFAAEGMIETVANSYCRSCGLRALTRLDFSLLESKDEDKVE